MEMTAQVLTASPQSTGAPNVTSPSAGKASSGHNALAGSAKEGKSFTNVLDQTLGTDKTAQPDDATASIEALLQGLGLSPALIVAMLALGQSSKDQGKDGDATAAIDPLAVKAMESLGDKSDVLDQLIGSTSFQQWLVKVSDLLSSMQTGKSANANELLTNNTNAISSDGQAAPKNAVQAKAIIDQFMTALSQNKDSLLFQQLVESFQEIASPVIAAQLATAALASPVKGSNGNASNVHEKDSTTHAQVSKKSALLSSHSLTTSTSKEKAVDSDTKMQVVVGAKQNSKLDLLSAKSGMADRFMLAMMETTDGSEQQTATDSLTQTNNLTNPQDLIRMLQGELAKPVQPMTAQSFVQDMSKFVLKNINVDSLKGFSEARLTLSPENLGQVDVKLTMHNGQLVAHFAAQTLLGKEMLEGQLSQLKQSLQSQGLQVEKLEVTQNSNLQSSLFQDHRQQQFAQQFTNQNKSKYSDSDASADSFSVEMANMTRARSAYANAFDVTA